MWEAGLISGVTTTPAQPGEVIILWGTGLGPSNPATPAGELVTQAAPLANPSDGIHRRGAGERAMGRD